MYAGEEPPGAYLLPGRPEQSRMISLIVGDKVDTPMPPDRLLPMADVDLISRWVEEGAPCN